MQDDFLWVEKYRPTTIEECILPEDIKETFNDMILSGEYEPIADLNDDTSINITDIVYIIDLILYN